MQKTFGEVVLFARTGLNPRTNFKLGQGNNKYITIKNIHNNSLIVDDSTDVVDDDALAMIHRRSQIKAGDVLFCSIGRIGDMYIIEEEPVGWDVNESVFVFTLNTAIIRQKYFYYLFKHRDIIEYLTANSSGSTFKSIKMNQLQKMVFDLPSLEEQDKIVSCLDAAADVIDSRQRQLRTLDTLIKARFVEMFGECDYPHKELIELIVEGAGLSYGIVQPGDDGTGDMGVLRPVDLSDGRITTASIKYIDRSIGDGFKKTELTGEELLITVRGTTGITALTDARFAGMNVTRGIAVIRYDQDKINPVYLNAYLNTEESQRYIQEHTRGATLQQINLSDLRVQQILVPPRALQDEYSSFVQQVDKSKVVVQAALDEARTLFDSIIQQSFG